MPKKTYIQELNEIGKLLREQGVDSNIGTNWQPSLLSIPDPFGVAIEQDSGITEVHVFVTQFSSSDVSDFALLLTENSPFQHRYNLESILTQYLADWCYDHLDECPYEPFLWALKITDNYIGSLQNNLTPQPWVIEAVGNALLSVWNDTAEDFVAVLQNVLCTWDWYQPIHVMLYLYQCLESVNNEVIDKRIREHWLYRALYSTTAFNCLCHKKKTKENIETLLRFISQDTQKDLNMAEIQITQKMRMTMGKYIYNTSKEEYAWAKTYYMDNLYNCSKKARQEFEEIFEDDDIAAELQSFLLEWKNDHVETEIKVLKKKLSNLFQKDAIRVISEVALSNSNILICEVLNQIAQQENIFNIQFSVKAMIKSVNVCRQYHEFILNKYEELNHDFLDDISFIYGCAFCQMGHPEILADLFKAHYLRSIGLINGRYIFADVRKCYIRQFNDQVEKVTEECLADEESALALILSCSKIYYSRNANTYPIAFNKICEMLLSKVLAETSGCTRYASALMDLYERIVNTQNRGRYKDALQNIALRTHIFILEDARCRAKKLLTEVYRAL